MAVIEKKYTKNGVETTKEYYTSSRAVWMGIKKNNKEICVYIGEMCMASKCPFPAHARRTCKDCKFRFP